MNQESTLLKNLAGKDLVAHILEEKTLPEDGWNRIIIEYLLSYLSSLDSNNFSNKASVGEREGRCFSDLVAKRSFYFMHGIGRSGDLTEAQPKAIGSSILYKLTNALLSSLMTIYNLDLKCLLVPVPIGTNLMLCLSTFRISRHLSEYVIWFREDNEIIFKSIINAGFTPIVLNSQYNVNEDCFRLLEKKINGVTAEKINSLISTTACTLPRKPDDIEKIQRICKKFSIPHIIISHYGLQSKSAMRSLKGIQEDDEIVILHNTGENFLVPIGSTLVTSCNSNVLEKIAKAYPGRASSSSTIDIIVTLLSLGKQGYTKLLDDKEYRFQYFRGELLKLSEKYVNFITRIDFNSTTLCLYFSNDIKTLSSLNEFECFKDSIKILCIIDREDKILLGYKFEDWGTYGINYTNPYMTFQLSLCTLQKEIDGLIQNLDLCLSKMQINS